MQFSSITLAALFLVAGSSSSAHQHLRRGKWSTDKIIDSDATTSGHQFEDFPDKEEFDRIEEYAARNEQHPREDRIQALKDGIQTLTTEMENFSFGEDEKQEFDEERKERDRIQDLNHQNRMDTLRQKVKEAQSHAKFDEEEENDSVLSIQQQDRTQELRNEINTLKDMMVESRTTHKNDEPEEFDYENDEEQDEVDANKAAAMMEDGDGDHHQNRINALKRMFSRSIDMIDDDDSKNNEKLQQEQDETILDLQNEVNSLKKVYMIDDDDSKNNEKLQQEQDETILELQNEVNSLKKVYMIDDDDSKNDEKLQQEQDEKILDLQNEVNYLKKVLLSVDKKREQNELHEDNKLNALKKMLIRNKNSEEEEYYDFGPNYPSNLIKSKPIGGALGNP